jgi:catalase
MSSVEKEHIIEAFSFELAKLEQPAIRGRVLEQILANIDSKLASRVGEMLDLASSRSPGYKQNVAPR